VESEITRTRPSGAAGAANEGARYAASGAAAQRGDITNASPASTARERAGVSSACQIVYFRSPLLVFANRLSRALSPRLRAASSEASNLSDLCRSLPRSRMAQLKTPGRVSETSRV